MTTVVNKVLEEGDIKEREKEILTVAAKLFAQEGFETVAVRNIAEAVGLSKATLYHYFKDKDEIYARIINNTLEGLCLYVEEQVALEQTAHQKLTRFIEAQTQFFEENKWFFVAMLIGFGGLRKPHEREKAFYWRDRHELTLRSLLNEGIQRGEFKPVNPTVAGRAILSTLNWLGCWYNPEGPQKARDFALEYAELFLTGLEAAQPNQST